MRLSELSLESFLYSIAKERPWISKVTVENEDRNGCKILVVKYHDGFEHARYLRYSRGPAQGFGWDIYGDDMQTDGGRF